MVAAPPVESALPSPTRLPPAHLMGGREAHLPLCAGWVGLLVARGGGGSQPATRHEGGRWWMQPRSHSSLPKKAAQRVAAASAPHCTSPARCAPSLCREGGGRGQLAGGGGAALSVAKRWVPIHPSLSLRQLLLLSLHSVNTASGRIFAISLPLPGF